MNTSRPPRVLLFAIQTSHPGSCRLPKLFKEAGFHVGVLGLRNSLLHTASHSDEKFRLPARRFEPLIRLGLERAFAAFSPDIIVPCDERAVSVVQFWADKGATRLSPGLRQCLVDSLGEWGCLTKRSSKLETVALARSIGVSTPRDVKVESLAECKQAAAMYGYPVMLKLSHGAGGNGVKVCTTPEELEAAFRRFERGRSTMREWRKWLLRRNWFGSQYHILVQEFVQGRPAMSCAATLGGRSLSIVTGVAKEVRRRTGPASVVHIADIPEVRQMTERMVEALGASGFISFDFIVDDAGNAFLLECNPRPTQIMHLGHLVGLDLARSFREALRGERELPCEFPSGEREVAFFPQEWKRDPQSPALATAFHDVPWEDAPLLRAMMSKRPITWRRRHIP